MSSRRPPAWAALFVTLPVLLVAACAPGGSGGSGLLDEIDLGGEEPDDIEGGSQSGAFTLSYAETWRFAPIGAPIEPLVPTISAAFETIEVSPPLPAGLELDPQTGEIHGTPAAAAPRRTYTVTAFNEFGSAQDAVELEVPGVARFAYVANAGDSTLSIFSVAPESGRLQHLAYQAQMPFQVQPEHVRVHPLGRWIYLANAETATIGTVAVDAATGRLQPVDADAIGQGPHALEVHPTGAFVYVVSNSIGTLRGFRVDPDGGQLEPAGAAVLTPPDPVALMIAPNGNYLITVHRDPAALTSYRIDTASGQLFLAQELELPLASQPRGGAIGAASDQAYVTLAAVDGVVRVAVDAFTAQMEAFETSPTERMPAPVVLRPQGDFAYALCAESSDEGGPVLTVFAVDAASGELSAPEHVPIESLPASASFSPDGAQLYAVDRAGRLALRYSIDPSTGIPTAGEQVRSRQLPSAVAVVGGDAAAVVRVGELYVGGEQSGEVWTFAVSAADGRLEPLGPPLETGGRIRALEVDPLRRYLYVADARDGQEALRTMALDGSGLPTPQAETPFGVRPTAVAADPTGRFVYVTTDDVVNGLFALAVQPDGSLENFDYQTVGFSPVALEVDPTGQFLYVVSSAVEEPGDQGDLRAFALDPVTGELSSLGPPAFAGGAPTCVAFSRSGDRAYSTFANTDFIGSYDIDAVTGALDLILQATSTGDRPLDLTLTPDGRFGFAAISAPAGSGAVELYDVRPEDQMLYDSTTGLLQARASFPAGTQPTALELSPDGRRLYVLSRTSADVRTFAVDAGSGFLTQLDVDAVGLVPGAMALSIRVE